MLPPGWQLEVLVPPAGVQKINVCFACSSLCSHELGTILSSTVPLVWLNPRGSLENDAQAWGVFSPTKLVRASSKVLLALTVSAGEHSTGWARRARFLGILELGFRW